MTLESKSSMVLMVYTFLTSFFLSMLRPAHHTALGMGKGPKRTLELVNYRLESRPLTDPRPESLGLDLESTQNRAQPSHIMQ